MTDTDLLYKFAKLYHQYDVKVSLMIENWTDKNYYHRYARNIQKYIRAKQLLRNLSDVQIEDFFNKLKENRLKFAYDYLSNSMKKMLEREKKSLSPEKLEITKSRLDNAWSLDCSNDYGNFEFMHELRRIEESEY